MASISRRARNNTAATTKTSRHTSFSRCPQALRLWSMFRLFSRSYRQSAPLFLSFFAGRIRTRSKKGVQEKPSPLHHRQSREIPFCPKSSREDNTGFRGFGGG